MKEYWLKNRNNQIVEFLIDIGGTAKDIYPEPKWSLERKKNSVETANCLLSICY